jgi:hypothetical protein
MTETEAVNVLLSNIGADKVNSLTLGHPDVDGARAVLLKACRRVQRSGWWFNRDYNITLRPEAVTKKINVSSYHEINITDQAVVKRGNYLYNRLTQSLMFEDNVVALTAIVYLPWDALPDTAQEVALYRAGAEFVRDELEDANKEASLNNEAALALIELKAEDMRVQGYNAFNKDHVNRARRGVRPYGRPAVIFFGTPDA